MRRLVEHNNKNLGHKRKVGHLPDLRGIGLYDCSNQTPVSPYNLRNLNNSPNTFLSVYYYYNYNG